jgi:hypothetical protein
LAAIIIALLFRSSSGDSYTFLNSANIPLYQFLGVIVSVFLGLIAGADEIIRERDIIDKEKYQEFSLFSYLNSKILFLFPVIAMQTVLYVLTGNLILGIKEMFGLYWIVLFSSAAYGALMGLVFSAGIALRRTIYATILPLVIAFQLLLGGGIVGFDKLNFGKTRYTPLIADMAVSRWAYEALAVEQFRNNAFEKLVYPVEKKLDEAAFYSFYAVPFLDSINQNRLLLKNELTRVAKVPDVFRFEFINRIDDIRENSDLAEEAKDYITYLGLHFYEQYQNLTRQQSLLMGKLADSLGAGNLAALRQNYHNLANEQTVTNSTAEKPYKIVRHEIVRTTGNVFQDPQSDYGRAAFYSPVKQFRDQKTNTFWFNISIIWFINCLCYIWVLFNVTGILRELLHSVYSRDA